MFQEIRSIYAGYTTGMTIYAGDREYRIPAEIFHTAMIRPPTDPLTMFYTIDLTIDGASYNTPENINLIITAMYAAAISGYPAIEFSPVGLNDCSRLPGMLAISAWARSSLVRNDTIDALRRCIADTIAGYVRVLDHLLATEGTLPTDVRRRVLLDAGVPVDIPELSSILLPTADISDMDIQRLRSNGLLCAGTESLRPNGVGRSWLRRVGISEIIHLNDRIVDNMMRREIASLCLHQPQYMMCPWFAYECEDELREIVANTALTVRCDRRPSLSVCDFLQCGIAAALG